MIKTRLHEKCKECDGRGTVLVNCYPYMKLRAPCDACLGTGKVNKKAKWVKI